jgi:hypothetical protein
MVTYDVSIQEFSVLQYILYNELRKKGFRVVFGLSEFVDALIFLGNKIAGDMI